MDFLEILNEIGEGDLNARLTDDVTRLARDVIETGGKGALTLRITISANGTSIITEAAIDVRRPHIRMQGGQYWIDGDRLVEDDPQQLALPSIGRARR